MMNISGCVPFHNNAATVLGAVESLSRQTPALREIVAVDDGSADDGAARLERAGVRVVRLPGNQGRGAARARAITEIASEFILSVDATKALAPDFLQGALHHMVDPRVAAVNGRNWQEGASSVAERWRGRHLFKTDEVLGLNTNANLNTNGVLLRRSAVVAVGGFDVSLRHSEDVELGVRLRGAGWRVVFDPNLHVVEHGRNGWGQVFERFWRYYVGPRDQFSLQAWAVFVRLAWRVMLPRDLAARDGPCALATAILPFVLLARWSGWVSAPKRGAAGLDASSSLGRVRE